MDDKTIAYYLQHKVEVKENSLKPMDKRHKIPKRIKKEIKELKAMIEHLTE
jgi:hypothetical protein